MGNILQTIEGAEVALVAEENRESAIRAYMDMQDEASRQGDAFYMTKEAYEHPYSFGDYYPAFIQLSWEEFHANKVLQCISQNTYDALTNSMKFRWPNIVENVSEFEKNGLPRGEGGFEYAACSRDFLCNMSRWKKWHQEYYRTHPHEIDWSKGTDFLPNKDEALWIIRREIAAHMSVETMKERLKKEDYHIDEDALQPLKPNADVLLFHDEVMRSYPNGEGLEGYAMQIGGEICLANYYIYEPDLSEAERIRAGGSFRKIYSIVKNGRKQYISLDFHKGMFEFHDCHGAHLGEFRYDGSRNSEAQLDHDLKTL